MADNEIFKAASADFVSSIENLPARERVIFSSCSTPNQLIADVRKLDVIVKEKRRAKLYLAPIERVTERLRFYFAAIDVLVQCDPIHAATAWGSLRLVIQLASNYSTFFLKLSKVLDRLVDVFPFYGEVEELCRMSPPVALKLSLKQVYTNLFKFLYGVLRVFYNSDGGSRSSPSIIARILWKPFDIRFAEILENMGFHQELARQELSLLNLKAANSNSEKIRAAEVQIVRMVGAQSDKIEEVAEEYKKDLEERQKDSAFHRIQQWLDPTAFTTRYEASRALREEGTANWIIDEPVYEKWKHSNNSSQSSDPKKFSSNVLWINGNPGSGKTVLAASIIEDLKSTPPSPREEGPDVCYFFFESELTILAHATTAFRAILSQLLQRHRKDKNLLDIFAFSMDVLSDGQLTASHDGLTELLILCCQALGRIFLVIDGFDECSNYETMTTQLIKVAAIHSVQIVVLSRPTVASLSKSVLEDTRLTIGRLNAVDISLFIKNKLDSLVEDGFLPLASATPQAIGRLVYRADGMFLWARLMMCYVSSPALSLAQREDALMEVNLPEGLEKMYEKILELILNCGQASRDLAKQVFLWLLYGRRRFGIEEFGQALLSARIKSDSAQDRLQDLENTVIVTCKGLVEKGFLREKTSSSTNHIFRLIHTSVRDYVLSGANGRGRYYDISSRVHLLSYSEVDAHVEIAKCCLQYLTYQLPARPLSGELGRNTIRKHLDQAFPFSNYAAIDWPHHLRRTLPNVIAMAKQSDGLDRGSEGLLLALKGFLQQPFVLMAWIEACYVYQHPPSAAEIQGWSSVLLEAEKTSLEAGSEILQIATDAFEFARYLDEIEGLWGSHLRENPKCIWEEVIAFTPSQLLAQNSGFQFHSLKADTTQRLADNRREITKISQTTSDGVFVAVLKIWSSREFHELYHSNRCTVKFTDLYHYSSGWIAHYEIYAVKAQKCVLALHIPLQCTEVWLQMWQTLWQDNHSKWHVQFPLSISPGAQCFTVLRTLYRLQGTSSDSAAHFNSILLPLEANGISKSRWTSPSKEFETFKQSTVLSNLDISSRFERRVSHCVYLYWIYFDHGTNYICFVDQARSVPNNFAVFHLGDGKSMSALPLVAESKNWARNFSSVFSLPFELKSHAEDVREFEIAFHPRQPLIVIGTAKAVFLWDFENGQDRMKQVAPTLGLIQDLSFSECGEYIVARKIGETIPQVIVVPCEFRRLSSTNKDREWQPAFDSLAQVSTALDLFGSGASKSAVVSGSNASILGDGTPGLTQILNTSTSINAYHRSIDGAIHESIPLTLLPRWADVGSLRPDVVLPSNKDEPVRIVLNKTAPMWNDLSKAPDSHMPGIIDRDQEYFRRMVRVTPELNLPEALPERALREISSNQESSSEARPLIPS